MAAVLCRAVCMTLNWLAPFLQADVTKPARSEWPAYFAGSSPRLGKQLEVLQKQVDVTVNIERPYLFLEDLKIEREEAESIPVRDPLPLVEKREMSDFKVLGGWIRSLRTSRGQYGSSTWPDKSLTVTYSALFTRSASTLPSNPPIFPEKRSASERHVFDQGKCPSAGRRQLESDFKPMVRLLAIR